MCLDVRAGFVPAQQVFSPATVVLGICVPSHLSEGNIVMVAEYIVH